MQEKCERPVNKKHSSGLIGHRKKAAGLLKEKNLYTPERQQLLDDNQSPLVRTQAIIDLHDSGYLTPSVEEFIWNMENVGFNSNFIYKAADAIKKLKDKNLLSNKLLQDALSLDIAHNFFNGVADHHQHLLSNLPLYQLALTIHQPSEFLDNYFKLVGKASIASSREELGFRFNGPRLIEFVKNSAINELTLVRAMVILAAAKFNEEAIYKIIQELPQNIGEEELIISRIKIIAYLKPAKYNQIQHSLNTFMDIFLLTGYYSRIKPEPDSEESALPVDILCAREPKTMIELFTKSKDKIDPVITENIPITCQLGILQLFYAEETTPGVFTRDHVAILKQASELGRNKLEILRIAKVLQVASALNLPLVQERINALIATQELVNFQAAIKIYFNDFPREIFSKKDWSDFRYAYISHLINAKQFNLLTFKLIIYLPKGESYGGPGVYSGFLAKISRIGFINEEFVHYCISRPGNFVDLLKKYLVKFRLAVNLENCNAIFRSRDLFFNQEVFDFIHYQIPDHLMTRQVLNRIMAICSTPGATPQQLLTYLRNVLNPPAAAAPAAAAQPQNQNPFAESQTVHTKSVNASTAQSARNLNERYKKAVEGSGVYKLKYQSWFKINYAKCIELASEYRLLLTQGPRDTKKIEDLQLELLKLSSIDILRSLMSSTYVEPSSQVPLSSLVKLIWIALHDKQLCTASEEDAERLFLEALYEIKRGYNINEKGVDNRQRPLSICADGSFKKLVEKMIGVHPDVVQEFYTPKTLTIKFNTVTKEQANRYLRITLERSEAEFRQLIQDEDLMEMVWEEIKADVEKEMRYFYQHIFDKDPEMLKAFIDNFENGQYTETSELEMLKPEVYEKIISENALAKTKPEPLANEGAPLELGDIALSRVPDTESKEIEIDSEEEAAEAPKFSSAAVAASAQNAMDECQAMEIDEDYGSSRKNNTKLTTHADKVEQEVVPAASSSATAAADPASARDEEVEIEEDYSSSRKNKEGNVVIETTAASSIKSHKAAEEMKTDEKYESLNRRLKKRVASPEQSDEYQSETEEDASKPLKKKTKVAHVHRSNFFGQSSVNTKREEVDEDYEMVPAASATSSLSFFAAQPERTAPPAAAASYSNPQRNEK